MAKLDVADVVVIGGGIFGAEVALKAKSLGLSVKIYEAKDNILSGASQNNQNRLHLGFHYPRDLETGRQSIRGFNAFREKYQESIQDDFVNAYFIANSNSLTSPAAYLTFCEELGVPFTKIESDDFPVAVRGADTGVLCGEVVYDCQILRALVWKMLDRQMVDVALRTRVTKVVQHAEGYEVEGSDGSTIAANVIVNSSYSDINRITAQLGYPVSENLYEYTAVPIIKLALPRVGVTIMDGPFMTVLPYGKTDSFLLYNVVQSVVASEVAELIPHEWLTPETAPFQYVDKAAFFMRMVRRCSEYLPVLKDAELVGFLEGPRMVLAKRDDSDARPSIVNDYNGSYISVFAGKIDHSLWVADEVGTMLKKRFGL
jgi:glycine/D-amino acid oxidase-like deaminating enzyme